MTGIKSCKTVNVGHGVLLTVHASMVLLWCGWGLRAI